LYSPFRYYCLVALVPTPVPHCVGSSHCGLNLSVHRSVLRTVLNRLQHALNTQAVGETRFHLLTRSDRGEQVRDLVGKGVFVAQDVARWPPGSDVGMSGFGDDDAAETTGLGGFLAVVEPQLVHRFEVERQTALRTVDLKTHGVLAPQRVTRGLETAHGTVGEPRQEHRAVVHGHVLHAAVRGALPHERLGQPGHTRDRLSG